MATHRKSSSGNMASPEQTSEAMAEWTTEDFLAAEPYPMPEVDEEMVKDFIDKMTTPSAKGGSTSRLIPLFQVFLDVVAGCELPICADCRVG